VAKILVADDNSNVHKTVTLALADLGVDVVSVSNGEAAVRKLLDFSPDLVLADIFMPVRSGYEVCEYVKKDSKLAHVPVVLLVGAFDPLDEREAQRVGADGILKKPFVPPDPLITMVKTILHRVLGDRLAEMAVKKEPVAVLATAGPAVASEARASSPQVAEDTSSQEEIAPVGRVAFGDDGPPVAFSTLLESSAKQSAESDTAVVEPVDDEQILTSRRDATLGDPIFWKNDTPAEESEDEVSPEDRAEDEENRSEENSSDELPSESAMHPWSVATVEPIHIDEPQLLQAIEPMEFVGEEQNSEGPSIVDTETIKLDPADQTPLTVESGEAPDLAANPIEWLASVPTENIDDSAQLRPEWADPIPDTAGLMDEVEASGYPDVSGAELAPALQEPEKVGADMLIVPPDIEEPEPVQAKVNSVPATIEQSATETARSIPKEDWAALTASLQNAIEKEPQPVQSEAVAEPVKAPVVLAETSRAAIETSVAPSTPIQVSSAQESAPDSALVEAVVQRVLDKMRPQVVEIITKEFLRPIVQALVTREISKH
jgi:CheY-like chemotaxis protein